MVCISVRNLVEFILRSGDIDQRKGAGFADREAMQMGSRFHRKLQAAAGGDYQPEVSLSGFFAWENLTICVEGRADGIVLEPDGTVMIDEIKGVMRSLEYLEEPVPVHLAQAKCYAYLYGRMHGWEDTEEGKARQMRVRMSYGNLETEEVRYFHRDYTFEDLKEWFWELLSEYRKWAAFSVSWHETCRDSIRRTSFPFAYREGQKELAAAVYRSIVREKLLFIQAPTGSGKTLSTLFPAVKAVGEGKGGKIFYLTARTIARMAAMEAMDQLRGQGLRMKSIVLTAKEKICPQKEPVCSPDTCPWAKGHFDRINDAVFSLITEEDRFDRKRILDAAEQYRVCPFELSLDLSVWMDVIICDYNYVFQPRAKLKRFFGEGVRGDYLFLIDEAHNLTDRGREMYSAALTKERFLEIRSMVKSLDRRLSSALMRCNNILLAMKREMGEDAGAERIGRGSSPAPGTERISRESSSAYGAERIGGGSPSAAGVDRTGGEPLPAAEPDPIRPLHGEPWKTRKDTGMLPFALMNLTGAMEDFLEEAGENPAREEVLAFYFEILTFLDILDRTGEDYIIYQELLPDGTFMLRLLCVDPSRNLQECFDKARSSILFSATLLPIDYYTSTLAARKDFYSVYAKTCFDPARLKVMIGMDTSSRYRLRSAGMYRRIAAYIQRIAAQKRGNYMVFFPSYRMLEDCAAYLDRSGKPFELLIQKSGMKEEERENFLETFTKERQNSLVGLCVMGSLFGEGIDLKGEWLIGAVVVGAGLPQVCTQQELLRQYYDRKGKDGFRYAYICPGMNKVLQAAGRVIRTEDDRGVVVLLDERFHDPAYRRMFPREWMNVECCSEENVGELLGGFWEAQEQG